MVGKLMPSCKAASRKWSSDSALRPDFPFRGIGTKSYIQPGTRSTRQNSRTALSPEAQQAYKHTILDMKTVFHVHFVVPFSAAHFRITPEAPCAPSSCLSPRSCPSPPSFFRPCSHPPKPQLRPLHQIPTPAPAATSSPPPTAR